MYLESCAKIQLFQEYLLIAAKFVKRIILLTEKSKKYEDSKALTKLYSIWRSLKWFVLQAVVHSLPIG